LEGQGLNREPKYDLRERSAERGKMGIPANGQGGAWGVTLSKEELQALKALLSKVDLEQH
jgi:hypothetical protein